MHNYYTYLYNQTVFEVLEEKLGEGEATVFARSATAGGQQFPVHWGGDSHRHLRVHGREPARRPVARASPASASGATTWAASSRPRRPTCTSAGARSACSRRTPGCTAASSYRVPWLFDERGGGASDVLRFFTKLKCRLMPYLFAAAGEAHARASR